jgi:hypothetical protein
MPADREAKIVRAARIEHALEMLLEPRRPAAVRKELRRKYGVSEAASRNYVNAAYELGGRELVKSLNTLRMESSIGSDEVAERIRSLAEGAEEARKRRRATPRDGGASGLCVTLTP